MNLCETRRILLVDRNAPDALEPIYRDLVSSLSRRGIHAHWTRQIESIEGDDIVIAHDPIKLRDDWLDLQIMGQRILNRKERLIVAEQLQLPVARWDAPPKNRASSIIEKWGATHVLYKADSSFRRRGVKLLSTRNISTVVDQYDPSCDVFMELLEGDSSTYKIDLFCGSVIGARRLPTRHPSDPDFYSETPPSELFSPSLEVVEGCVRLSKELEAYGSGYISVDLMRCEGDFKIIEVNSCGVGRMNTWPIWPEVYVKNYATAIEQWEPRSNLSSSLRQVLSAAEDLRQSTICSKRESGHVGFDE